MRASGKSKKKCGQLSCKKQNEKQSKKEHEEVLLSRAVGQFQWS